MPHILVLNPNSSQTVTASIAACLEPLRAGDRHQISCTELADAPLGIESDADVAAVIPLVQARLMQADVDAAVIACFSDPGVVQTRAALPGRPIIGIAEAAYYAALQLGARFGVISLGPASIARHAAHLTRLGIADRLAADRDIGMSVAEGNRAESFGHILSVARALRDVDGADAIVLGCAGMGLHRAGLQQALGLPVVDPVQAAVGAAMLTLDLGYYSYRQTGA